MLCLIIICFVLFVFVVCFVFDLFLFTFLFVFWYLFILVIFVVELFFLSFYLLVRTNKEKTLTHTSLSYIYLLSLSLIPRSIMSRRFSPFAQNRRLASKISAAGSQRPGAIGHLHFRTAHFAQRPAQVVIANRTYTKACDLAALFTDLGAIEAIPMAQLQGSFDWIINGTSASLTGDLPPLPKGLVSNASRCYDMMYGAQTTAFNQWALDQGAARADDGLGMLVEQAAQSFHLWRGVLPPTAPILLNLRAELKG